jgi:hypothetical protein
MSEGEAGSRSRLGRVRRRIERWRERYGGRGQPIPEELWDAAVDVARTEGVEATARGLRVDRGRLSRRMGQAITAPGSPPDETTGVSGGFVEVDARGVCAPGQTVLRFEGRDGERLEVELGVSCALDIADLARAFWSRWP